MKVGVTFLKSTYRQENATLCHMKSIIGFHRPSMQPQLSPQLSKTYSHAMARGYLGLIDRRLLGRWGVESEGAVCRSILSNNYATSEGAIE